LWLGLLPVIWLILPRRGRAADLHVAGNHRLAHGGTDVEPELTW